MKQKLLDQIGRLSIYLKRNVNKVIAYYSNTGSKYLFILREM